jgi:hypothetical protein
MTISPHLPNIAGMRSIHLAAAIAATTMGTLLVAGCRPDSRQASLPAATASVPATARTGQATGILGAVASASTGLGTGTPGAVATASTGTAGRAASAPQIPIFVESDTQMKAEGNDGPSSSILLPTSCRLTGTTVTAEGTYTNSGFVPNVYNRYGDIIVLYVRAAPSPGYAEGMQLATSEVSASPVVGSRAPWRVSLSISPSVGVPAQCVVAAQPTHAGQFAP